MKGPKAKGAMLDPAREPVTTVHIVNIPSRVTDAEFNCWFLFAPGFEDATLQPGRNGQQGWARFSSVTLAGAAIDHLHGLQLSPKQCESGTVVLAAEMATKNFWGSPAVLAPPALQDRKRPRTDDYVPVGKGKWDTDPGGKGKWGERMLPVAGQSMAVNAATPMSSTVYIRNISASTSAELLRDLMNQFEGFVDMKYTPDEGLKPGGQCWAKFSTPAHAQEVLPYLDGHALPGAPDQAVDARISKNDLNKRADHMPGHGGKGLPAAGRAAPVLLPTPGKGKSGADAKGSGMTRGGGNPPTDTMFVGNIDRGADEDELQGLIQSQPGFVRLKSVDSPRRMIFALYESVQAATDAITVLANYRLVSAPDSPLFCQYSKNSLDVRK